GHLLADPPRPRPVVPYDGARRDRWVGRLAPEVWPDLLADYGIAVVPGGVARTRVAAGAEADRCGYPVGLKAAEPDIHPKTEADGVRLGLRSADEVATSYDDVAGRLGPTVHVQRQVSGVEVALGIVVDPLLGPLVMVAAGGTLVELVSD